MIPDKMKAVVMTGVHEVELHDYNVPECGDDQVLIKVLRASICTIDQRPYAGLVKSKFPRVGGHEGAGIVVQVGKEVKGLEVGDKVTVGRVHCGVCENCVKGIGHCENGPDYGHVDGVLSIDNPLNLHGCFAQYIVRKPTEVYKIPEGVNYEDACIAEPLSDVVHSIRRSRLSMGETCVLIGVGIMGILHIQVAKHVGARVIVAELDPDRRQKAKDAGADFVFDPSEQNPTEYIKSVTGGRGADVVFYMITKSGDVFDQYFDSLAPVGRIMIYANQIPDEPHPVKLGVIHNDEKEIVGTVGSQDIDFYRALKLMQFGMVDIPSVINRTYALEDCKQAYEDAVKPNTYRCVIRMNEE